MGKNFLFKINLSLTAFCNMAVIAMLTFFALDAFAQNIEDLGFFQKVFELIEQWGGLNFAGRIAAVVFLLVGAMKVSFLSKVWDFFGEYKPLVPLVLALIHGIVSLGVDPGTEITWPGVTAYLITGAGALVMNNILDFIKAIPGIGSMVVTVIDFLQIIFKSSKPLESKNLALKREMKATLK